jgi:hypothetical protein
MAFHLAALRAGDVWAGDVVQYLLHARNLAEGAPYAATGYVQNPENYWAPVSYPPGLPIALAALVAAFGFSSTALKVATAVFLVGAVGALARLFRRDLPGLYLWAFALAAGLHPYLWEAKDSGFPAFLFLLAAALGLLLYEEKVHGGAARGPGRRPPVGWVLGAGAAVGYALATRALALVLLPALVAHDVLRRGRPGLRSLVTSAVAVAVYLALASAVGVGEGARVAPSPLGDRSDYAALFVHDIVDDLAEVPARVRDRAVEYGSHSYALWSTPLLDGHGWRFQVYQFALLLTLPLVGLGLVGRARRGGGAAEAFCVLYALGLLPWSFGWQRYLIPLVPFYFAYLFMGLRTLEARVGPRVRYATLAVSAALAVVYASAYAAAGREAPRYNADVADARALYAYVRTHAPPDAVVATTFDPRYVPFHTRRAASVVSGPPAEWPAYARRVGATYLAARDRDLVRAGADLGGGAFREVFSAGDFTLYRVAGP